MEKLKRLLVNYKLNLEEERENVNNVEKQLHYDLGRKECLEDVITALEEIINNK